MGALLNFAAAFDYLAYRQKSDQSVYGLDDDPDREVMSLDDPIVDVGNELTLLLAGHQGYSVQLAILG